MPQPRAEALQSETAVQSVIEILVDSQEGLVTVGERLQDQRSSATSSLSRCCARNLLANWKRPSASEA